MSCMTAIRAGMCPELAPKLISDLPARAAYHSSTGDTPTSSSSAVVTPSIALKPIGLRRLAVRVEVDEPGRDDQARDVDVNAAVERRRRDGGDASAGDTDVAHRVEAGLGIEDPASVQNDVVRGLGVEASGDERSEREQSCKCQGQPGSLPSP